ncbi:vitamin K epoxide reductase family protein [Bacillus cereus]|uniref:vitamin K epoxide reductase family protein n=1 Tax=Bacillus cereus TaxID=1396 RepID=UPI003C6C5208
MKKILAFVGLLISLYLYFSKGHVSYCPTKGCDIIANSEYARIGIFPISLIGILGYLILINFYVFYKERQYIFTQNL